MPRHRGLRDDDTLGRLADIERRLDEIEAADETPAKKDAPKKE